MIKTILTIFLFTLLFGCNQSKISIEGLKVVPKGGSTETAGPIVTVTNVEVVSHQLVISGTDLDSATSVRVTGPSGFDETFDIESKAPNQVIANSQSNLSILVNGLFSLIVSNAYGAATYTITFELQDGQVTSAKLDDMGANPGEVLTYDGSSWGPAPLTGLSYKGTFDATSVADQTTVGAAAGHYYIVSTAGSRDPDGVNNGNTYSIGDWAVYNGATSQWDVVIGSNDVTSVAGKTGVVTLSWSDFSKAGSILSDIANVDVTGRVDGDILVWNNGASKWQVQAPVDTNTNAGTLCSAGEYLDGDGTCKIAATATTSLGVNAITSGGGLYFTYQPDGTACTSGQVLVWNTINSRWECGNKTIDTDTNTNAATLCSAGEYLDGDGTCKTAATATTSLGVDAITSGAGLYFTYLPSNAACTAGQVLEWDNANSRWVCGSKTTDTNTNAQTLCSAGEYLDGDGTCKTAATTTTSLSVGSITNAASEYFIYRPNNTACTAGQILEWDNANSRWVCGTKTTDTNTNAGTLCSAGEYLDGDGTCKTVASGADNLGNHTAGQNIILGSHYLSGDGGDEGLLIDATGNVTASAALILPNDQPIRWGASYIIANGGSNNLRFHTNGGERMRLNSSNLGIGTTAPSQKLSVKDGNILIESDSPAELQLKTYRDSNNQSRLFGYGARGTAAAPTASLASDIMLDIRGYTHDGSGHIFNTRIELANDGAQSAGDNPSRIDFSTTPSGSSTTSKRMSITNSGNVGIGTTSPNQKLHVQSSGPTNLLLETTDDAASTAIFVLKNPSQQWNISNSSTNGAANENDFVISDITAGQSRLLIQDTTGNVGVGITNPTQKLTVAGNINVTTGNDICIDGSGCLSSVVAGAGEANTAANAGAGVGVFKDKTTTQLNFRSLASSDSSLTLTQNTDDINLVVNSVGVNKVASGAGLYFTYQPNNAACTNDQVLKWSTANTRWECGNDTDTDTTYSAGNGIDSLLLAGGSIALDLVAGSGLTFTTGELDVDTSVLQKRVSGTCAAGSSIREIAADGTVTCETDDNTSVWSVNGSDAYYSTGNVGIGTAAPSGYETGTGSRYLVLQGSNGSSEMVIRHTGTSLGHAPALSFASGANRIAYIRTQKSATSSQDADLQFGTSDGTTLSEKMRITKDGSVGIGTTTPSTLLHVNGTATISNGIYLNNSSVGQGAFLINSANESLRLGTNNLERMRIDPAGNVGIGTTSPTDSLHVSGANSRILVEDSDSAGRISIRNGSAAPIASTVMGILNFSGLNQNGDNTQYARIQGSVTDSTTGAEKGYLSFYTQEAGVSTEQMRISHLGHVGIGTTNPGAQLEVEGAAASTLIDATSGNSSLKLNSVVGARSTLSMQKGGLTRWLFESEATAEGGSDAGSNFALRRYDDAGAFSGTPLWVMRSNGYVGVNMTTPNESLTVNGVLSLSKEAAPSSTAGFGKIYVKSSDSKLYFMNDSGVETDLLASTILSTGISSSADATAITIDSSERVGIGTGTPSEKLEVVGNIKTTGGNLWSSNGSTGTSRALLLENYDDTANQNGVDLALKLGGSEFQGLAWTQDTAWTSGSAAADKDASLSFGVLKDNTPTTAMTLTSDGFLGLGTSAPTEFLHVKKTVSGGKTSIKAENTDTGAGSMAEFYALGGSTYVADQAYGTGYGYTISNAANGYTVGTYAASPLIFATNSTEAMRIQSDGKVGIGYNNPQEMLHIDAGSLKSAILMTNDHSGRTITDGLYVGYGGSGNGVLWNYEPNNLVLGTNNTEYVRIKSDGKIGIGTQLPSSDLEIKRDNATLTVNGRNDANTTREGVLILNGARQSDGRAFGKIDFQNYDNSGSATDDVTASIRGERSGANGSQISFYTSNSGALTGDDTDTEKLVITNDGDIGIGTDSPIDKLTIWDSTDLSGTNADEIVPMFSLSRRSANRSLILGRDSNSNENAILAAHNADVRFGRYHSSDTPKFTPYMVIKNGTGNLGIGTTSPSHKVHVSGSGATQVFIEETSGTSFAQVATKSGGITAAMFSQPASGYAGAGTNTATDFILRTSSTERMRIQDSTGNVGIGTSSPDQLLSVNGNASKTGGTSWAVFSDARLKTVTGKYVRSLEALRELTPVYFHYNKNNPLGIKDTDDQVGFVAQEVQKVIPEAVEEMESGYLQLQSDAIFWTMLNSIKELDLLFGRQMNENLAMLKTMRGLEIQVNENSRAIASLEDEVEALKEENQALKEKNAVLEERLERIEKALGL